MFNRRPLILTIVLLALMAMLPDARAFHHPRLGRFMQRDPLGYVDGMAMSQRAGEAQASFVDRISERSQEKSRHYSDGSHLYEYVGSAAIDFVDPNGTIRLKYEYNLAAIRFVHDRRGPDHLYIGSMIARKKGELQRLMVEEVEPLLKKYGIDASWKDYSNPKNPISLDSAASIIEIPQKYRVGGKVLDLLNIGYDSEWKAISDLKTAHDIIVYAPGYLGTKGKVIKDTMAAHHPRHHVIGVAGTVYSKASLKWKKIALTHEILHHFLGKTLRPGGSDPAHDSEGIMHESAENGKSVKLGCKTVKSLESLGVTEEDIDREYIIDPEGSRSEQ